MVPNKKYSHFYILKCETINEKESLDVVYDNLSYREALKCFKKLRLELEETSTNFVHIILMGVTAEGRDVIVKTKEIAPNDELPNLASVENSKKTESVEESVEENYEAEDVLDYNDEPLTYSIGDIGFSIPENLIEDEEASTIEPTENEFSEEESILEESKNDFSDYVNELAKSIKEIEEDKQLNSPVCNSTNTTDLESFAETKLGSSNKKSLKSLNLKDYYNHISEVDSADILKVLVDVFSILDKKHSHNNDMIHLLTKRRDCYCHDLENLAKTKFESIYEKQKYILTLASKIEDTSLERRKFKNELSITEKVFKNLSKVRKAYYTPITKIDKNPPKFDMEKAVNIKTYEYNYSSTEEREALLRQLKRSFDKIIDVKWGTFECYNKVGSTKPIPDIDREKMMDKVDIIDEVSAKSYEAIINQVVKCGSSFLKTKGSSVKITNVNNKAMSHLTNHIHHKYSKCVYDSTAEALYLIERL